MFPLIGRAYLAPVSINRRVRMGLARSRGCTDGGKRAPAFTSLATLFDQGARFEDVQPLPAMLVPLLRKRTAMGTFNGTTVLEQEIARLRARIVLLEDELEAVHASDGIDKPIGHKTGDPQDRNHSGDVEQWLTVTLRSIADGVIATDTAGRITFLNPTAAELIGCVQQRAVGQPIQDVLDIVHERTGDKGSHVVERALAEGRTVFLSDDMVLVTPDGSKIPIEDSAATPIRNASGTVTGVVLVFHDVTEKRRAQQALSESEQRVRLKLHNILSPDGDLDSLELGDIIDSAALQALAEDLYALTHIPFSIIDMKGNVLVGIGWQDICTKFHRIHPDTCQNCVESDTRLSAGVPQGESRLYRCKNNMWDVASPIFVGGRHVGNLFSGQFFFEDEPLNEDLFRSQARQYGFDEPGYLAALERVPRLSRTAVDRAMAFFVRFGHLLSQLSYRNIQLARSLSQGETLTASQRQSEEMLNRAEQIAHLGSWHLDLTHNRLTWSDEVYRIFGLEPQQFGATYEAFLHAVHPDDREQVNDAYSGSLRDGRDSYEIAHRIVRSDTGAVRWVHEKCEHIRDEAGTVVRSVGMVHDITDRKSAEENLRASEGRERARAAELEAIMDAVPAAIFMAREPDCRVVMGNRRTYELLGLPAGTNLSKSVKDTGTVAPVRFTRDGKEIPPAELPIQRAAGIGKPESDIELDVTHDGKSRKLFGNAVPLIDGAGRPYGSVAAFIDITELKRIEDQLRHAQKLESIGVLAGGVAHDFNNILTSILGHASLLQLELPATTQHRVQTIIESSERAASLTRQLLAYAGKGRFHISDFDVAGLVRSSADLLGVSIPKNVELILQVPETLPNTKGDSSQIQQVLMNLVLNAAEAIPEGKSGHVTVEATSTYVDALFAQSTGSDISQGWYVRVSVTDNGCGMDEETKRRIFDPFFSTKFTGRGLGLAAIQGILRSHKGVITVQTTPGQGSKFDVYLPCSAQSTPECTDAEKSDSSNKGATVLVVDDEVSVRSLAEAALECLGHKVLLADNGRSALESLRANNGIDLVLLDLIMPVMGGPETFTEIRRQWPNLPILLSSGYSRDEARRLGLPDDAPLLEKPYTVQKLKTAIATALNHGVEADR